MLKAIVPKFLYTGVWRVLRYAANKADEMRRKWYLWRLRRKACNRKPGSLMRCLKYTVRINDGPNFYILYKDIFVRQIYHFEAQCSDPLILDCGSNVGMSILYFKHAYPRARIIGFEPDPAVFPYLQENISLNGLADVQLVKAALAEKQKTLTFYSDGKYGSCLAEHSPAGIPEGWVRYEVPCVRLRDYLNDPVDLLKMNIEGAEWEVLVDSKDRLRQIQKMIIEYHHLPSLPRTLHKILLLLHEQGFEYVVSDFGLETYSGSLPPTRLNSNTCYFRQIYARRVEDTDL